jgi:hypothetical protein
MFLSTLCIRLRDIYFLSKSLLEKQNVYFIKFDVEFIQRLFFDEGSEEIFISKLNILNMISSRN